MKNIEPCPKCFSDNVYKSTNSDTNMCLECNYCWPTIIPLYSELASFLNNMGNVLRSGCRYILTDEEKIIIDNLQNDRYPGFKLLELNLKSDGEITEVLHFDVNLETPEAINFCFK
jgi:hypothetical protein